MNRTIRQWKFGIRTWAAALALMTLLPCAPCQAFSDPLLYVRIISAPGAEATFFRDERRVHAYETPVAVGLRPGYLYRMQLTIPRSEGEPATLFPSLQVLGTLHLPPHLSCAQFPTPVVFTPEDVERALSGVYITKVIYLECPDLAEPLATDADRPIETLLRPDQDPLKEARAAGRVMLVVRFGERPERPDELARQAIPGTVLLPGEKQLPPPAVPPAIPWVKVPVFDPIVGPRPKTEECLHDGGDIYVKAGLDNNGELHGLDPSDTIAEFTDSCGKRCLTPSNRVCVCVPRFLVLRSEAVPVGYEKLVTPIAQHNLVARVVLRMNVPPLVNEQTKAPLAVYSPKKPSESEVIVGPHVVENLQGTTIIIGQKELRTVYGTLEPCAKAPPKPLVLTKCADRKMARIGDVVTFTLEYTNPGGAPITNVVVSDSLTPRLEYVAGSSHADRDVVFTTQENEAGSVVLRWEIGGDLQPGQKGKITFQARVR